MLPDWHFGGDEAKRQAFTDWAIATLDKVAVVTTSRFIDGAPLPSDWLDVARHAATAPKPVGRPIEGDAVRSLSGMDAALWDYMLLKYLFARLWPGKRRRMSDGAHAAQIAARRNRAELSRVLPDHDDRSDAALAAEIYIAWRRWDDVPGRRMADADIAFLEQQPKFILP